jgi:hypothetical protein
MFWQAAHALVNRQYFPDDKLRQAADTLPDRQHPFLVKLRHPSLLISTCSPMLTVTDVSNSPRAGLIGSLLRSSLQSIATGVGATRAPCVLAALLHPYCHVVMVLHSISCRLTAHEERGAVEGRMTTRDMPEIYKKSTAYARCMRRESQTRVRRVAQHVK